MTWSSASTIILSAEATPDLEGIDEPALEGDGLAERLEDAGVVDGRQVAALVVAAHDPRGGRRPAAGDVGQRSCRLLGLSSRRQAQSRGDVERRGALLSKVKPAPERFWTTSEMEKNSFRNFALPG